MSAIDHVAVSADIDAYFDRLDESIELVDLHFQAFQTATASGDFKQLEPVTLELQGALATLENLLDQRGSLLLRLTSDGKRPKSLRQYLKQIGDEDRLQRADMLAQQIELQRQRSITVFTAHYWMFETTREVIRMITNPGPNPGTYGMKVRSHGGGLFDEAA